MDLSSISPDLSTPEQRLDRYLAGTGTLAELAAIRQQLQRDGIPENALDAARQHFDDIESDSPARLATERARLLERIHRSSELSDAHASVNRTAKRSPILGGVGSGLSLLLVALVVVLAGGMWTLWRGAFQGSGETLRRYSTTAGQQATVTFANGSRATLGPATRLTVRSGDGRTGTIITLDGVALFSVAPNAHAPFSIHAGRSITRVLGTTFLVRRYGTDRETRVIVSEGRVSVASQSSVQNAHVLDAGSLGIVNDSGTVRIIENVDDVNDLSTGTLQFNNTPLYNVAAELSRAYGVEIHVSDSVLAEQRVKWNVQTTRTSLRQALEQLPLLFDVRIVRSGSVITLVPGRSSTHMPVRPSHPFIVEPQHGR